MLGQSIQLTGTVCPNPGNLFEFVVDLTYTSPQGHTVTETEQIGYGALQLCNSQFVIDTSTSFNSTGVWQIVAQAQWTDSSGAPQSLTSNTIYFNVAQGTITATTTSTTQAPPTYSNSTNTLVGNGTQYVPSTYYYYEEIDLSSANIASFIIYYTVSNASISTAIMTQAQYNAFSSSSIVPITDSLVAQNSTYVSSQDYYLAFNGLLVPPGIYYFLFYAYGSPAEVSYYYNASLSLQVVNETTNFGSFFTVPPQSNFSILVHTDTLGSPSKIAILGTSNETLQYDFLGQPATVVPSQGIVASGPVSDIYSSPPVTTTNVTAENAAAGQLSPSYNFSLSTGLYEIVLTNPHDTPAFAYLTYQLTPQYVNPYTLCFSYCYGDPNYPAPTGIAAFGLENNSGTITPYNVSTSEVIGVANISSIQAYNATAVQCCNADPSGASLQLNSMLVVNDVSGAQYTYWTQDVMDFVTANSKISYVDNIFNMTGDNADFTNNTISSRNALSNGGVTGGVYGICDYPPCATTPYKLPLHLELVMKETVKSGQGIFVQIGVVPLQNGTASSTNVIWFDNIMISDPNASTAYFYVSGYQYTPTGADSQQGSYYDTELVYCGEYNYEATNFKQLSSTLGLYYVDSSGNVNAFPSYYSFGHDTGETSDNVHVTYYGNGVVQASAGTPTYVYLAGSSTPSGSSTSSSRSSGQSSVTTRSSGSSITTTKPNPPSPPNPAGGIILIVVLILIVAGAFIMVRRRHKLPPPPPLSEPSAPPPPPP